MLILALETSCDDTAVALLQAGSGKNSRIKIVAHSVSSQFGTHAPFGGVVPILAAREHEKNIQPVLGKVLNEAQKKLNIRSQDLLIKKIDYLAVTSGPGLAPSLLVGVNAMRALGYVWNKKIIGVNHLVAHVYANFLDHPRIKFPALALIVSGGHTQIMLMRKHLQFKLIGQTRDDAAGETFDKTARLLGLEYPGGPAVARHAQTGNPGAYSLPRPMLNSPDFDFSFSGLKTAVLYLVRSLGKLSPQKIDDLCASTQAAIVETLVTKTMRAAQKYKVKTILLGGGVAANESLAHALKDAVQKFNEKKSSRNCLELFIPPRSLCTDNAQMIAVAAYYTKSKAKPWNKVEANANLKMS